MGRYGEMAAAGVETVSCRVRVLSAVHSLRIRSGCTRAASAEGAASAKGTLRHLGALAVGSFPASCPSAYGHVLDTSCGRVLDAARASPSVGPSARPKVDQVQRLWLQLGARPEQHVGGLEVVVHKPTGRVQEGSRKGLEGGSRSLCTDLRHGF